MRLGKFTISRDMIERFPSDVLDMFYTLEIIPVRAELLYPDTIKYTGVSNNFEECPLNLIPPYYKIITHKFDNGNYKFTVEKYNG